MTPLHEVNSARQIDGEQRRWQPELERIGNVLRARRSNVPADIMTLLVVKLG
jgi:hypothetical protein